MPRGIRFLRGADLLACSTTVQGGRRRSKGEVPQSPTRDTSPTACCTRASDASCYTTVSYSDKYLESLLYLFAISPELIDISERKCLNEKRLSLGSQFSLSTLLYVGYSVKLKYIVLIKTMKPSWHCGTTRDCKNDGFKLDSHPWERII